MSLQKVTLLEVRGFAIKQVKNTVLWTYVIEDLNGELIVGTFC